MAREQSANRAPWRPAGRGRRGSAALVVGGYAIVGVTWILVSDSLLRAVLPGRVGELVASVKGVGFIVVTTIALWGILAARDHVLARTERERVAAVEATSAIFRSSPLAIVAVDRDGLISAWSPAAEQVLGWRSDEVVGHPATVLRPDDPAWVARGFAEVMGGETLVAVPVRYPHRDGRPRELELFVAPLRDETGGVRGAVVVAEDVTAIHEAQSDRARLATAIDHAAEAIVVTDPDGRIVYANPAFERVTGYSRAELLGQNPRVLKSGLHDAPFYERMWATLCAGDTWRGTLTNRRKDGTLFEEEAAISPVRDATGQVTAYVAVKRDLSAERALQADLRAELEDRSAVRESIRRIVPGDSPEETSRTIVAAILALDGVDHATVFHFPANRDEVVPLATSLPEDFPTRVGTPLPPHRARYLRWRAGEGAWVHDLGREPAVDSRFETSRRRAGITASLSVPLVHAGRTIGLVGCLTTRADGQDHLARRMGSILEVAAHASRLLAPQLAVRQDLEGARATIREIIREGRFHPVYQPIVRLADRCVIGYEALTRFDDGVRPDVRFAEAAALGCGPELEEACLRAAITDAAALAKGAWLCLNASGGFVLGGGLTGLLGGIARQVVIELTEHVAVDDYPGLRAAVEALGDRVWLAVDDAGAGFSGLRHVVELRPHVVKLDLAIVRGIDDDPARQSLVAGMVHYATLTASHLVAEGVETAGEAVALAALGVELAQGYLFARPAPIEQVTRDDCAA
jgi:PAS domain S-box-containing protein